jgi:hypothetical protein
MRWRIAARRRKLAGRWTELLLDLRHRHAAPRQRRTAFLLERVSTSRVSAYADGATEAASATNPIRKDRRFNMM